MGNSERQPKRTNSKVVQVYPHLVAGEPRYVIEQKTGLHGYDLTEAIRGNYRLGYIDIPPLEERRRRLAENTSRGKGGVELAIKLYLPLDLTAKQTVVALAVFNKKNYSQAQIAGAYAREVNRHGYERPRKLWVEAQRDKRRSRKELLRIVRARLRAAKFVAKHQLEKPKTLEQWKYIEEQTAKKQDEQTGVEGQNRFFRLDQD